MLFSLLTRLSTFFYADPPDCELDRYGRVLTNIWVKGNLGFLNLNEGLVAKGLASHYLMQKAKLQNRDKLIDLQKFARERELGMWKGFQDYPVLKTKNGTAFHSSIACTYLPRSKHLINTTAVEAMDLGMHPCRSCTPEMCIGN